MHLHTSPLLGNTSQPSTLLKSQERVRSFTDEKCRNVAKEVFFGLLTLIVVSTALTFILPTAMIGITALSLNSFALGILLLFKEKQIFSHDKAVIETNNCSENRLDAEKKDVDRPKKSVFFEDKLNYGIHSFGCPKSISETQREEYTELMKNTPEEEIGENWKKYVVFQDSKVAVSLRYSPDQERYGNWMHQTVRIATNALREKKWGFNELLGFLTCSRRYIAANGVYGVKRPKDLVMTNTLLNGPYQGVYDFYKTYTADGKNCIEVQPDKDSHVAKAFVIMGNLKAKQIPLSIIQVFKEGVRTKGNLFHTQPVYIKPIMDYVKSELYPQALKESDKEELKKILGRIFWWICQAKPWKFGDPSIAETLIRTLWAVKDFEQPAWQDGVIPWVEVANEPDVERFAESFHKLFK